MTARREAFVDWGNRGRLNDSPESWIRKSRAARKIQSVYTYTIFCYHLMYFRPLVRTEQPLFGSEVH